MRSCNDVRNVRCDAQAREWFAMNNVPLQFNNIRMPFSPFSNGLVRRRYFVVRGIMTQVLL